MRDVLAMLTTTTPVSLAGETGEQRRRGADERATYPPPRVCMVARTERSPGFGPSLAFPVSQWRRERSASSPRGSRARYSGGAAPVLHRLPSVPIRVFQLFNVRKAYRPCPAARKSALERVLEPRAVAHDTRAHSAAGTCDSRPGVAHVQIGQRIQQRRRWRPLRAALAPVRSAMPRLRARAPRTATIAGKSHGGRRPGRGERPAARCRPAVDPPAPPVKPSPLNLLAVGESECHRPPSRSALPAAG